MKKRLKLCIALILALVASFSGARLAFSQGQTGTFGKPIRTPMVLIEVPKP